MNATLSEVSSAAAYQEALELSKRYESHVTMGALGTVLAQVAIASGVVREGFIRVLLATYDSIKKAEVAS